MGIRCPPHRRLSDWPGWSQSAALDTPGNSPGDSLGDSLGDLPGDLQGRVAQQLATGNVKFVLQTEQIRNDRLQVAGTQQCWANKMLDRPTDGYSVGQNLLF